MNIIYRGCVGDIPKSGRKAISAVLYLSLGFIIMSIFVYGYIHDISNVGILGFLFAMWVCIIPETIEKLSHTMAWVYDDRDEVIKQ